MAREPIPRSALTIEPTESESSGDVDAVFIRETPLPSRYVDLGLIAFGASGDVHRVRDTHLSRVLAMKIMRSEHIGSARKRARFIAEVELTAELQHPGIIPIHDWGELEDGRVWFTMQEVRGRTFHALIDELHAEKDHAGFHPLASGFTFRRAVDTVARLAQTVAYAHEMGIVHRDIKPMNVMVGDFGAAFVMDWGLARRIDDSKTEMHPVTETRRPSDFATATGDVLGTPPYMSPEQARGEYANQSPAIDVYALGAILYHLLAGSPPYRGSGAAVLRQVLQGPPLPLSELPGRVGLPVELMTICERAMRRDPGERYADAQAFARDLLDFLDGARRREQALSFVARARALAPEIAARRTLAADLLSRARLAMNDVRPYDSVEIKRPIWGLEDEAAGLLRDVALHEATWLGLEHGALSIVPDLPEAHAMLADHYHAKLVAAEHTRRTDDAVHAEALLRCHDQGRYAAFLTGNGSISVYAEPEAASVLLSCYEPRDRRLVPIPVASFGKTPIIGRTLRYGSYLVSISAPQRAEVRLPVFIERGVHWDAPRPIMLPHANAFGPDDCYVPEGYAFVGGDEEAVESLPGRRIWVDGFVLRRFAVTHREYIEFLDELMAAGRQQEALEFQPRIPLGMVMPAGEVGLYERDTRGRFMLGDSASARIDPDEPVTSIDWYAARAYARWLAQKTGLLWRLPDEIEREKAARGVDGRAYPWGNHADAMFAWVVERQIGTPKIVPVNHCPTDESPYGVRGLAGNTRDWCANVWRPHGPRIENERLVLDVATNEDSAPRAVRGGAYISGLNHARSAARFALDPKLRRATLGVRVARSFSGRSS